MGGIASVLYGGAIYVLFLGTFLYAIAFVANVLVPKTIDSGTAGPVVNALICNVLLLGVFAVQHSVMARQGFKRWWTQLVPPAVERSTYVLFASAALLLLYWQWQPMPVPVWTVKDSSAVMALHVLSGLGWVIVLVSTFLINHFELFGLRQVYSKLVGKPIPAMEFRTPLLYKHVRHPIYLGFLMSFWAAPVMTVGHLLFAAGATGYILVGIWFEVLDLIHQYGDLYRAYRQQVGMLLPRLGVLSRVGKKAV